VPLVVPTSCHITLTYLCLPTNGPLLPHTHQQPPPSPTQTPHSNTQTLLQPNPYHDPSHSILHPPNFELYNTYTIYQYQITTHWLHPNTHLLHFMTPYYTTINSASTLPTTLSLQQSKSNH
jgi:hypothetical protein